MIITGGPECGPGGTDHFIANARTEYYKRLADLFEFDISGEKLDCADMEPFDPTGSANPAVYWDPVECCSIVQWQTAYSALVVGNYQKCLERAKVVGKNCSDSENPRFFNK